MRQPRLGPTLGEVNLNSLQPQTNILDKANIKASTNRIQEKIEEINARLTQGEKETILAEASKEDPTGYVCEKQILNITEVSFVFQLQIFIFANVFKSTVCFLTLISFLANLVFY